ncbi:hypothetical protein PMAYCL1PPCAC_16546, partial [Pristionchus mayeri]
QYELLFCVQDDDDASISIVRHLREKYPNVDVHLFIGGENAGLNPKVNNMLPAYMNCKYQLFLISDSSIRMTNVALVDMIGRMDDNIAQVHQLPFCADREEWGPNLEQVYFGTEQSCMYLFADCMNMICTSGMSVLIRKEALEECGGLAEFGDFLAEDYFIADRLRNKGWSSTISGLPAIQNSGCVTAESLEGRLCRWAKLRYAVMPQLILIEPLHDWLINTTLFSISMWNLTICDPISCFLTLTSLWITSDYFLFKTVNGGQTPFPVSRFLLLWLRRETFAHRVYLKVLCNPEITWRKGTFRLEWGGRIKAQTDKAE